MRKWVQRVLTQKFELFILVKVVTKNDTPFYLASLEILESKFDTERWTQYIGGVGVFSFIEICYLPA